MSSTGGDTTMAEPSEGSGEEGCGTLLALVWQQLGVGKPARSIDGDMRVIPADATVAHHPGVITGHAMADAVDAAELLDVDVDPHAEAALMRPAEWKAILADHLEQPSKSGARAVQRSDQASAGDDAAPR